MQLLRAATTVGVYTALSRILGLIREILMSHVLGASLVADAFVVAFKFPNFFRSFNYNQKNSAHHFFQEKIFDKNTPSKLQ